MKPIDAFPDDEVGRLRRHLRALSAVNRQLHAQVGSGTLRGAHSARANDDLLAETGGAEARLAQLELRRTDHAGEWIEQLQLLGGGADLFLVRSRKRGACLVEGPLRRRIGAGMVFAALESVLGPGRDIADAEIDRWDDGPPVEVLEARTGTAFLIVGGRRLSLRGLPLPHPVTVEEMLSFPEGAELRIGAESGRVNALGHTARARALLRREGFTRSAAKVVSRARRRLSRSARAKKTTS